MECIENVESKLCTIEKQVVFAQLKRKKKKLPSPLQTLNELIM